jgi:hypothetical protein
LEGPLAGLSREKARTLCLIGLFNPIFFVPITVLVSWYGSPASPPAWAGKARIAVLIASAYMIIAPFLLALLLTKSSEQLRSRGIDLHALLALMGIAGAVTPSAGGLMLVVVGDRVVYLQIGLVVSIVTMGYWSWRERALLFPSRPPVVQSQHRE